MEVLIQVSLFLYNIGCFDGAMIGEPARTSVGKPSNTVRLLRYNSHICYVSIINALFKTYCHPSCDVINFKGGKLERHSTNCKERFEQYFCKMCINSVKHCLKNLTRLVYLLQTTENSIKMAVLDFESNCLDDEKFKDNEALTWIGKHNPVLVYRPTWYKNPFSSAILILEIWYRLSVGFRKIGPREVKFKIIWTSLQWKQN